MLNLRLIISTFTMIFVAELGDKTQLSIFTLATGRKAFASVVLGAAAALVLTTLLAAALGSLIGRFVPEKVLKFVSAGVFLTFGVLTLIEALKG